MAATVAVVSPAEAMTVHDTDSIVKAVEKQAPAIQPRRLHPIVNAPRVQRNSVCPCNSGKKFKHCCLKTGGR